MSMGGTSRRLGSVERHNARVVTYCGDGGSGGSARGGGGMYTVGLVIVGCLCDRECESSHG